jgi:hypothetical protein
MLSTRLISLCCNQTPKKLEARNMSFQYPQHGSTTSWPKIRCVTPSRVGSLLMAEIIALRGIHEVSKSGMWSSARIASKLNQMQTCRGLSVLCELAQHRESSTNKGTSYIKKLNFIDLRGNEMEGRPLKLGVSLGSPLNKLRVILP